MSAAADPATPAEASAPKGSKLPLILGAVLAVLGGAGGFYAVQAGLPGMGGAAGADDHAPADAVHLPEIAPMAFVPLPPIVVNLPGPGERRFLRFAAQLEVDPAHLDEVTALTPRVVDLLNGYLRAVEVADLEDPSALLGLRAQMLRRAQVVAGGDRVRDLLVMEFVVN